MWGGQVPAHNLFDVHDLFDAHDLFDTHEMFDGGVIACLIVGP